MTMTDAFPSSPMFTDAWGANYRLVEPGEFVMGDVHGAGAPSEQPTHTVQIMEPFFLGERPVTQAHWADVMGENPSKFQEGWSAGLRPVEQVSLDDVEAFLMRLNNLEEGQQRLGLVGRWRLPSEAEWEYAAKAGSTTRWHFGDRDVELDQHGWHAGNSGGTTREVGLKDANDWGFHDLNGLINEWCSDAWCKNYETPRQQNPHTIAGELRRVVRGGAWFTESDSTRSSARSFAIRTKQSDGLGLRLVWAPSDRQ